MGLKAFTYSLFLLTIFSCIKKNKDNHGISVAYKSVLFNSNDITSSEDYLEDYDSFYVVNETRFKVDELENYTATRRKMDTQDDHYFIGNNPIYLFTGDSSFLQFQGHKIFLDSLRTIDYFGKGSFKPKNGAILPKAFSNGQYYEKYSRISNTFESSHFGVIKLTRTGQACEDSQTTQFELNRFGRKIVINNLINGEVFEDTVGQKLYIVDFFNCPGPHFRIFRISAK